MRSAVPDLEWKAPAIADLLAIIDYISDDNPDAAQALKNEIEAKTSGLPEAPKLYRPGRVDGTEAVGQGGGQGDGAHRSAGSSGIFYGSAGPPVRA